MELSQMAMPGAPHCPAYRQTVQAPASTHLSGRDSTTVHETSDLVSPTYISHRPHKLVGIALSSNLFLHCSIFPTNPSSDSFAMDPAAAAAALAAAVII